MTSTETRSHAGPSDWLHPGLLTLVIAVTGAAVFFAPGLDALLKAWSLPEYSHGPLIPILSGFMFLRELKQFPADPGPKRDRWIGVMVILFAIFMGALGRLANIDDIVAYAIIVWIAGLLLVSFGWSTGWHFWPPVLHLVYMLPLPDTLYIKTTNWLQLVSSEIGVWFLRLMAVPVFLEGNIIDLGVTRLHVADACSGLRYMFPILSFSYIFAVLYRGPVWHKAVLLLSAVPITVLMNSVRIAVAGILVQYFGLDWLEGFTHFFEGWVIFIICIAILFGLARIMLVFHPSRMGLAEALDLEFDGLPRQAARLRLVRASAAMITVAVVSVAAGLAWQALPERGGAAAVARETFATFPRGFGDWRQEGLPRQLETAVEAKLSADDHLSIQLVNPAAAAPVEFFSAWYADQSQGNSVHSPEVCLPGGGWEIAWLERTDMAARLGFEGKFDVNRAIIQKGETRMMVYYWFEQRGRRLAWDMEAKFWLMMDGIRTGDTNGGLVRLTTPILSPADDAAADARLVDAMLSLLPVLPRFLPDK